ncbi:MAG: uncharacterized protein A8A55_0809 [Amphiamblys sp. WSBS2006]|nr:MAG: uncharacterized protein A8A55_0809 [Amphiamblys sp. WSBS2006]
MKILGVSLATHSVCVCAFSSFTYIPKDILPRFQTEQNGDVYILNEGEQPKYLCSVYFRYGASDKRVPSPVSLLRFVYDETEAKTHYPNAKDITEEVARLIADHAEVDTERRLFFVSFANDVSPVQAVPKGIAEVSVLNVEENGIDYCYKKEIGNGNIFDRFLIAEECKREDKNKPPRIKNIPAKRKEAVLLLSFLAAKEFHLHLEAAPSIQKEGNKWSLKLPYGVSLFVSEESSCCLELFNLTETKIKTLAVSSFDITRIDLKNTHIEELVLVDEVALDFFYDSIGRSGFHVEKVSFGTRLNPKSKKFLNLIKRVQGGETAAPRKIQRFVLNKNSFFVFLEETRSIPPRKIHVEDLAVTIFGKDTGPETGTSTRIAVSKRISIKGNVYVLLFIDFDPELSHLNIDEIQRQRGSPGIKTTKINMVLTKNKINVRENLYGVEFFKRNITATEMSFFAKNKANIFNSIKITLVSGEMEDICFRREGFSVLPSITNEKINVRQMKVMDITCFSDEEKEEAKKKEFVIRERLYMRSTGIFFLELLGNTAFIPVIEIKINCWKEHWGGFEETVGINVGTNALVENINQEIEGAGEIKQTIGEMINPKETVVKNEGGYQKLVFEEYSKHEIGESGEKPIIECQILEEFKEHLKYEEQREPEESSEQPSTECQILEEDYRLLEVTLDICIPEGLFFPEEDWYLQGEEVSIDDTCWNHLFELRG